MVNPVFFFNDRGRWYITSRTLAHGWFSCERIWPWVKGARNPHRFVTDLLRVGLIWLFLFARTKDLYPPSSDESLLVIVCDVHSFSTISLVCCSTFTHTLDALGN